MIRQAISCDICGNEKRQTNHWFVAHDQGGELRVAGWSSRNRLRPGSKHLCGQTCLHKLVDEFMAKAISGRGQAAPDELELPDRVAERTADRAADRSTSRSVAAVARRNDVAEVYEAAGPLHEDGESSARLIKAVAPAANAALRPWPTRAHPELVPPSGRPPTAPPVASLPDASLPGSHSGQPSGPPDGPEAAADASPRINSREWRAEAWNRERNRESHNGDPDSGVPIRRRSGS